MKIDVLDTFQMYMAIKCHFTSDYDFFFYKGRFNQKSCTFEHLLKKPYYNQLLKLSKQYEAKEICDYFVSNMLVNEGQYIFDIDAEGKRIYADFLRRKDSRSYIFRQDVNRVCMELSKINKQDFWDSIEVTKGQHPLLFRMFVGSFMAPETMCILYQLRDYIAEWDPLINDGMLYPVVTQQIRKLSPFIRIKDHEIFSAYIREAADANF